MSVRVRIAPSPTGDPHLGNTDRARSTPESEVAIMESLAWLGLQWDEGPDVGGPHAPYRQSERTDIYREHLNRLLEAGHAYLCFCTPERLAEMRAAQTGAQTGYDRHCRDLDVDDSARRAPGETHVVRMKVPVDGECSFQDLLRGEIRREWASVDDQIILKSDGFPTYHLANVVDDHLMGITHVIRGEEWISSVPKHVQLYRHFGWDPPVFCHLPLLRNPDKSKLSKRKNPTSIRYFQRAGFLPEALRNYLGTMGWAMPGGEEKFTLQEMCDKLELEKISLGGPVFDVAKLKWLNGRYIREDYDTDALLAALEGWSLSRDTFARIVPLVQQRLEKLSDWGRLTAPFFADEIPLDPEALTLKGKEPDEVVQILQMAVWRMEAQQDFSTAALDATLRRFAETIEVKLRDLTVLFYVALSGTPVWTPLFDSMSILGPDLVRMRLRRAVEALGGVKGKKRKLLEKQYAGTFGVRP